MTAAEREFREFFAAEYGRLRGLGFLLTGDWAQAEELAQDALVRTYRAWSRVRRHERPVSAELRRLLYVPVARDTTYLEASFQPSSKDLYRDDSTLPRTAMSRPRPDPPTRGRFPEGRGWFRTDGRVGPWQVTLAGCLPPRPASSG